VIATSVKGDLLQHTVEQRRQVGETWVSDPVASTDQSTVGWSPLHTSNDWQGALRMAAWLASTARAGERGGLQDSDFWYAVARNSSHPSSSGPLHEQARLRPLFTALIEQIVARVYDRANRPSSQLTKPLLLVIE